ncbi:MAG: hypothetical protein ACOX0Y_03295 [Thiopseudomonas sp.]
MQYTNQTRKTFIDCKRGAEHFTAHITVEIVSEGFCRGQIVAYDYEKNPAQNTLLSHAEAVTLLNAAGINHMSDSLAPESEAGSHRVIEPTTLENSWVFWPRDIDFKIKLELLKAIPKPDQGVSP